MLRKSCLVAAASALISLGCVFVSAQRGQPTVSVAAAGAEVQITGQAFRPAEPVYVVIYGQNLFLSTDVVLARWTVFADRSGTVTANWPAGGTKGMLTIALRGQASRGTTSVRFASPTVPTSHTFSLNQCRNGDINAPLACTEANWVNGNLNASQAHYMEGQSVPYRLLLEGLDTTGTHTLTLEYDSTQGGHHAIDYLTSFDRTETKADPCSGAVGCDLLVHTHDAIPVDPAVAAGPDGVAGTSDDIVQMPGEFALFGGTITGISGYTVTGSYAGASQTSITITFTTNVANPVLAWGGHIARRQDWGVGNSAIAISGAPFHMRILDSDGEGGGNQDRGLQGDAVYYPGSIVIVQDTRPHTLITDFWFDTTGPSVSGFWLDDDGDAAIHYADTRSFTDLTGFGTPNQYEFWQTSPSPYRLWDIVCTSDPQGGSGTDNNTVRPPGIVTITLEEGELVTCTFINTIPTAATVSVSGRVMSADGFGLRNAKVTFAVPGGITRTTYTNAFGYYVADLDSGQTYLVRVNSKGYGFTPIMLNVPDTLTGVDFNAVR